MVKNVVFTILVPGTMAGYVPYALATRRVSAVGGSARIAALLLFALGALLYAWCVWNFAAEGRGTPAPIDPPRELVARGPYRYVRNPMYIAVLAVIAGWIVLAQTRALVIYGLALAALFHLFVVLVEEPQLRRRFGAAYDAYCRSVSRWVPHAARRLSRRMLAKREFSLPSWAHVGRRRRDHIERVALLLEQWAKEMDVPDRERDRWLKAAWLHDALRDAELGDAPHGAAAADKAERDGETDRGVLDAIRYHSTGYAMWDDVGKMLYLADYLEPGRRGEGKERARLAERVPRQRDRVLQKIVAFEIRSRVRRGRPVHPLTVEFWNSLARR